MLLTINCLIGYSRLVACCMKDGTKDVADLVFKEIGLPKTL
jgi:hypothetical protein